MTMQLEFTVAIQDVLNYERYHHPMPLVQRRREALWLKSHGLPHGQIAHLVPIRITPFWYTPGDEASYNKETATAPGGSE
jgi:hypothetical protein